MSSHGGVVEPLTIDAIDFSRHCAERWNERGRPCASLDAALDNLRSVAQAGHVVESVPTVTNPAGEPHLVLGDYRFPLVRRHGRLLAVTCKVSRSPSPGQRLESATGPRPERRTRRPRYRRPNHVDWLLLHETDKLDELLLP